MFDEEVNEQHRYLFTVRQSFGEDPSIDSFYQLTVPDGLTGDQAEVMTKLDPRFCKEELVADSRALQGMQLRLRFNSDMFKYVCMVRTPCELTYDELSLVIEDKARSGKLLEFLEEAAIK